MSKNPAMTDDPSIGGLCVNCRHAPECIFPRQRRLPVLQCEEFECIPCAPRPAARSNSLAEAQSACEKVAYLGLCSNCRHRESCTFPKPEGGVWHCEEYE